MSTYLIPRVVLAYGVVSGGYRTFKLIRRIRQLRTLLDDHIHEGNNESAAVVRYELHNVTRDDVKPTLMYWTVFAVVTIYDVYFEFLVRWFPFYYMGKTLAMLWLSVPQTKGTTVLFEQAVQPMFASFQVYFEKRFKPFLRNAVLLRAKALQGVAMDKSLERVSAKELRNLHGNMEQLLIELKRERDRRDEIDNGDGGGEGGLARTTSADFRRRLIEGEDLDSYDSGDDEWNELKYEKTQSGHFRLQSTDSDTTNNGFGGGMFDGLVNTIKAGQERLSFASTTSSASQRLRPPAPAARTPSL